MELPTNGDLLSNSSEEQRNNHSRTGYPVQIIEPIVKTCEHESEADCTPTCREIHFSLNEKGLQEILLRDDVKDKKVCLLSVVGAFRKGKSFLLDLFLHYLHRQDENWLTNESERIGGFKWRGGSEKETEGIWMWSEPFIVKAKPNALAAQLATCAQQSGHSANTIHNAQHKDTINGTSKVTDDEQDEEICVLLMDVQGTFDSCSTVRACATIFALTAMLSSVQIYNLSHNIQEDDLQHLQVFTEYGRVALAEDSDAKPFQNLVMLVRDWSYPYEAPYGFDGGATILERRLAITDRQHSELQQLRRYIRECFASLRCFLMPHPGLQVATSPHFDGALSQIGPEFREALGQFVPELVGPQHVAKHTKRVAHQEILTSELLTYFRAYIGIFQTEELPQPKTMYEATAEANNQAAAQLALDAYRDHMDALCGASQPFVAADLLSERHTDARDQAMRTFRERRKMGGPTFTQRYESRLTEDIDQLRCQYEKANESKSLTRFARTPVTLLVTTLFNQIVASVFGFIGLGAISVLLEAFGWILISAMGVWCYAKYAGRFAEAASAIDAFATSLFDRLQGAIASNASMTAMRTISERLQAHAEGQSQVTRKSSFAASNNNTTLTQRKASVNTTSQTNFNGNVVKQSTSTGLNPKKQL